MLKFMFSIMIAVGTSSALAASPIEEVITPSPSPSKLLHKRLKDQHFPSESGFEITNVDCTLVSSLDPALEATSQCTYIQNGDQSGFISFKAKSFVYYLSIYYEAIEQTMPLVDYKYKPEEGILELKSYAFEKISCDASSQCEVVGK